MKDNLFVDANILCSLYNPDDTLHKHADRVKSLIRQYNPVISNFILLETYTILSQRVSKKFALSFGERIRKRHQYAIFWIDKDFEDKVWKIFKKIKDKNFSYVDASILAVIKAEKIKRLLSFDTSFKPLQKEFGFQQIGV